jgi:dienelactone hydrolase
MKITRIETVLLTGPCTNAPFLSETRLLRSAAFVGVVLLVLLFCAETSHSAGAPATPVAPKGDVLTLKTPDGVRFGIWGTEVRYPAPTLLVFSATIEQSLGDAYYRQCGNALAEQGFLCVSLDLPGHGVDTRNDEPGGLGSWRVRSDHGEDFVAPFAAQVRKVLDYLIQAGYTDPDRIAACGTSRGGFMALQVTAAEPRIRATAAFAPVTALRSLREFQGATNTDYVDALSLYARAGALAGRSLWIIIGDRDERVGTDDAISFARRVTTLSLAQAKPADLTLIIQPESKGHTTPAGAPELAADWIGEKLK